MLKRTLKKQLEDEENRANFYYSKLWMIDTLIENFEESKNKNSYTLIRNIKNVLDKTSTQI